MTKQIKMLGNFLKKLDAIDTELFGFFHRTGIDGYELGAGFDVASGLIRRDRTPKASADVARHWASGT